MVKRPCGETLKIKRNVKLSFAGSSAFEGRVLDSLLSITCDAKGAQNLAYNGRGANRLGSTFTHEHEKSVEERSRARYSCHWVTTLSSSTKSATRLHCCSLELS